MLVEIWSDVVCPWCYIGKRRFESALARFEHADEVSVRWRSFELDPSAPVRGRRPYAEHVAAKYGLSPEQALASVARLDRMAAAEGITMDLAATAGGNTFAAHRLVHLAASMGPALAGALEESLFAAYFTELRPIGEPQVLHEVATGAGLDATAVTEVIDGDRFAAEVRQDEATAAAYGCTGVPFFVFDGALAVPGAQDTETFLRTMQRWWERRRRLVAD